MTHIEQLAWTDILEGTAPDGRATSFHGGTRLVAPTVDSLLFNRVLGADGRAMAEAARQYRAGGVERFLFHQEDGGPEVRASALAAGLERYDRAWALVERPAGPVDLHACPFELWEARPEHRELVSATLAQGFDVPESGRGGFAGLVGRPGWTVLTGWSGSTLAGVGLLYLHGEEGYLAGGVTAPAFRGRGLQSALIGRRLRRAFERGARLVRSETGEAIPGEPNSSMDNMLRAGFRVVGRREHYCRPGTGWTASSPSRTVPVRSPARP